MIKIFKKLRLLLDKKQKLQMAALVPLMILGAIFETASIALVLTVVTSIIAPDGIESNRFVYLIYDLFGFKDVRQFTIVSMVLLIIAFIVKNAYLFLEITDIDEWGKKKLAYEIQKMSEGYYYFIHFDAEPTAPAQIESRIRIVDDVLRFLCVTQDEA